MTHSAKSVAKVLVQIKSTWYNFDPKLYSRFLHRKDQLQKAVGYCNGDRNYPRIHKAWNTLDQILGILITGNNKTHLDTLVDRAVENLVSM